MQDSKLQGNISWLNLVAHFLKTDRLVKSVLLPNPLNPTHIITSHTNRSTWHIKSIVIPTIRQMLSPINRTRFELPCSLGTTISPSATSRSSAKSDTINIQAR